MNESWLESWVFTSSQASEEAVHYITYIWKTTYSNSNQVFLKFCSIEFFLTLFFYLFKKYFWPGRGEPVGWRWVDTEYPLKCRISTEIVTVVEKSYCAHKYCILHSRHMNKTFSLSILFRKYNVWSKLAKITCPISMILWLCDSWNILKSCRYDISVSISKKARTQG